MRHKFLSAAVSLLLSLSLLLTAAPCGFAASSAQIQKEIDNLKAKNKEIQAQINAIKKDYDANYADMSQIVAQKTAIDQEMTLLGEKIQATNEQINAYGQLIADTQEELESAQENLDSLSVQHRQRIRAMEEEGRITYWKVIFEARNFSDLLGRISMVEEIDAADRRRMEEMRIAADLVDASKLNLEADKSDLESVREELARDEDALKEKRVESDLLLFELEKKSEEFQLLMDKSEALQDELLLEIAEKQVALKEAKADEELARLAAQGENPPSNAQWLRPVSGFTLTSPFGMRVHPVLNVSRMHNGIDMACAQGTPIYATRAGKVTVTSYQAGGAGNYVGINHLDGFSSVYMHMTHYVVSAGQSVSAGQLIGYVGSTGLSTGPHLHFGISYAGTYVNPLAYIY